MSTTDTTCALCAKDGGVWYSRESAYAHPACVADRRKKARALAGKVLPKTSGDATARLRAMRESQANPPPDESSRGGAREGSGRPKLMIQATRVEFEIDAHQVGVLDVLAKKLGLRGRSAVVRHLIAQAEAQA